MLKATVTPGVLTTYSGIPCRVWEGVTEGGAKFRLFACGVAVHTGEDQSEFEKALDPSASPRELRDVLAVPLRMLT